MDLLKYKWYLAGGGTAIVALVIIVSLLYLWYGRSVVFPSPKTKRVYFVGGASGLDRRGDVVFVHGLNGDYLTTWGEPTADFYWPKWLCEQSKDIGVWAVDYDSAASEWLGKAMPIEDRADNLLNELHAKGVGKRPIIFVCHSLGGIVVKEMLRKGATLPNPDYQEITSQTRGVVFLATPHSGSYKANLIGLAQAYGLPLRKTELAQQLHDNSPALRSLNQWYVNAASNLEISTKVFFEKYDLKEIGRIVDETSSNPGMTGVFPVPVDADHLSICKPTASDDLVVNQTHEFIGQLFERPLVNSQMKFGVFLDEFAKVRSGSVPLEEFKAKYQNTRFSWEGYVRQIDPQDDRDVSSRAAYFLSEGPNDPSERWCYATFSRNDVNFDKTLRKGAKIRLSGTFSRYTQLSSPVLRDSRLEARLAEPP